MSANNWTFCPRCLQEAKDGYNQQRERVMALYGTVPVDEFDEQRAALSEPIEEPFRTFREDYEFWTEDGKLHWGYSGACTKCNLRVEEKGSKRFWDSIGGTMLYEDDR